MAEKVEGIHISLGDGLRCTMKIRGHEFFADEPEDQGGQDEGPTPGEMFLASLGGCTAMTLRMYANLKKWPLETVEIEMDSGWVDREECADWPEGEERKTIPRIFRKIRLTGDLDEKQVERLKYIARRCPVHRIVTEHPHVVDDLALAD